MNENINQLHYRHVSWGAVIAGALIIIGFSFLFHLLSMGVGLTSFTRNTTGANVLLIGGLAWLIIGGYLVLFFAGWITGKLVCRECLSSCAGMVHGFLAWCLALLIIASLMSHVAQTSLAILPLQATNLTSVATVDSKPNTGVNENTVADIRESGLVSLATFVIFLAGALGASFGGYTAVRHCRKDGYNCPPNTVR